MKFFVNEIYLDVLSCIIGLVFLNIPNGASTTTAITLSIGNFAVRSCNSQYKTKANLQLLSTEEIFSWGFNFGGRFQYMYIEFKGLEN
jgi:hypothetical protein